MLVATLLTQSFLKKIENVKAHVPSGVDIEIFNVCKYGSNPLYLYQRNKGNIFEGKLKR
jgi:hypothetical protein